MSKAVVELVEYMLGQNIRQIRKTAEISQSHLGSLMNPPISGSQVLRYEKAKDRFTVGVIFSFAECLGQLPSRLFVWPSPLPDEFLEMASKLSKEELISFLKYTMALQQFDMMTEESSKAAHSIIAQVEKYKKKNR